MNNIELTPSGDGFDWLFKDGDLVNVRGDSAIISSVLHNIFLSNGELELEWYKDKGSLLNFYSKLLSNENSKVLIRAEVENQCMKVEEIADAKAEIEIIDGNVYIQKITLTKKDGGLIIVAKQG